MAGWYIWRATGPSGPLSNEDLARSLKTGEIGRDEWLWHDWLGQWTMAGAIDFLWPRRTGGGANETEVAREQQGPAKARTGGQSSRPRERPSLTALYLNRLKLQRGEQTAVDETDNNGFVDDLAAAASAAPEPDRQATRRL